MMKELFVNLPAGRQVVNRESAINTRITLP